MKVQRRARANEGVEPARSKGPIFLLVLTLLAGAMVPANVWAQTDSFTYQGELLIGGEVFSGGLDTEFALFDAASGGSQVGPTVAVPGVAVESGLFEVELDFGAIFDGTPLWLEIRIKDAGSADPFMVLLPRQPLSSAPAAVYSVRATDADTVDGEDAVDLQIQNVDLVGTELQITEGGTTFTQDLGTLVSVDGDGDPTNELNTSLELNGTNLELTDAGGTLIADLSSLQDGVDDADADPTNELISGAMLVSNILELVEGGQVTNLVDLAALLNATLELDGTTLRLTDGGGTLSADLSSLQDGVDDADADPGNELNTTFELDGTDLELTDAGGTLTADLSALPVDDADADPTNELISDAYLTNGSDTLEIVESDMTNSVDLTPLQNASLTFDGTSVSLTDGGGTLSADISTLGDDADADPGNELNQTLELSGTDLELTDAGGTLSADLSGFPVDDADADPTNELISDAYLTNGNDTLEIVEAGLTNALDVTPLQNASLTFDGTSVSLTDGGGTLSADISALGDDADANPANELNTAFELDGTNLELTDAGGTLIADLSSLADGVADADADPTNELITDLYLTNGNDRLDVIEGGLTNSLDVTPLQNASLSFDGTSVSLTDGGGTLSADISALGDDADADPGNELNSSMSFDGTNLQLIDAAGTLTVDLSVLSDGVDDADADPTNELITDLRLTNASGTLEIVEGGLTNSLDISPLLNTSMGFAGNNVSVTDGAGTVQADLSSLVDANTALTLSNTILALTDPSGTLQVDLSPIDGINDLDTDPTNELIVNMVLNGSTLEITEGGNLITADLSSLTNTAAAPTALYSNLGWSDIDNGPVGTGPSGTTEAKILEIVETATSNRFEIDFNRIQPGTIITNIPITITQPGLYYLTRSLSASVNNADGITIDADNVTIDMKGYTLYGGKISGTNSDDGIFVLGSQTNLLIRDGGVVGWGGDGINAASADFSIFSDLHVGQNDGGGLVADFNCVINRVTAFSNQLDGIEGDDGTTVSLSTAGQNGDDGIRLSEGCVVADSASYNNGRDGFDVSAGSVVSGCSASGNQIFGFDVSLGGQITGSAAYNNVSNGFDMASACIVRDCIASENGGQGIRLVFNGYVTGSVAHANVRDGIRTSSTDCHVQNNLVTDNGQSGITAFASGSLIMQNMASGNVTNWSFNTGSAFGPIIDVSGGGDLSGIAGADHPWANFTF